MEAGTARQEETEHLQAERISIPADGRSGMEWAGRTSLIQWRIPVPVDNGETNHVEVPQMRPRVCPTGAAALLRQAEYG